MFIKAHKNMLNALLLEWFEENKREFPWRKTSDPYLILVAEKLLQQSIASNRTVLAFNNIIRQCPTVWELSKINVEILRDIFQPLGLIYRADELSVLAKEICKVHSGFIPNDIKELKALPGIGEYIARAILCFGYENNIAMVDTNVSRLLYRVMNISQKQPSNPARNKMLIKYAEELLPLNQAKEFNLAIIDFCAMVCTSRTPQCNNCPIGTLCKYTLKNLE